MTSGSMSDLGFGRRTDKLLFPVDRDELSDDGGLVLLGHRRTERPRHLRHFGSLALLEATLSE
jgi:hypothetical protein